MYLVIEKINGNKVYAIDLEADSPEHGKKTALLKDAFPNSVAVGDVFTKKETNKFILDEAETRKRKERINSKFNSLKLKT